MGRHATWQTVLFAMVPPFSPPDNEEILALATRRMQGQFPGPYELEWYMDSQYLRQLLRPRFEDQDEELLWKIKYS